MSFCYQSLVVHFAVLPKMSCLRISDCDEKERLALKKIMTENSFAKFDAPFAF